MMFPLTDILMGHLVGDYLLQNKWMALNKSASTFKCLIHCLIYTISVALFTYQLNYWWWVAIFISHFPIDRWNIADRWLCLINGRSLSDFVENGNKDIPLGGYNRENYHILRGGFTAFVYAMADNTMHLLLMYVGWYLCMNS